MATPTTKPAVDDDNDSTAPVDTAISPVINTAINPVVDSTAGHSAAPAVAPSIYPAAATSSVPVAVPAERTPPAQEVVVTSHEEAAGSATPIEADDAYSDSGYDTDATSLGRTSPTSSAFTFIHEHGHRYHRKGEALIPNDETEQDRLDLQHHIFKLLLDGELLFSSIGHEPLKILDIGTGTGIWPIEMGDTYEACNIIGIDESPIQPSWVPPNVQFEIDDVTKPWLHKPNSVDFIHIRTMAGSISDWTGMLKEAFKVLKPGGRIEVTDIVWKFDCNDGTFREDSYARHWESEFHKISQSVFHVDFAPSPKMAGFLAEAGFEFIRENIKVVPVGPWPKDPKLKNIGRYFLSQMLEGGMENYSISLFTKAGWNPIEVHALLGEVRKEIKNPKIHSFTRAWFITARKINGSATE